MGGIKRRGDLLPHLDDLVDGNGSVGDPVGEARPRQELHDEVCRVTLDAVVVHRHDAGVVQPGGDAGLALEASRPRLVGQPPQVDGLDGDLAPQHGVGAAPHLAHPTAPDRRLEDVATGESSRLTAHPGNPTGTPVACPTCSRP